MLFFFEVVSRDCVFVWRMIELLLDSLCFSVYLDERGEGQKKARGEYYFITN